MRAWLSEFRLYLANHVIAYVPSHRLRLNYYRTAMQFKIGNDSSIFLGCKFDCAGGLTVGENTTINDGCVLDTRGGIKIGSNVALASSVFIITAKHDLYSPNFSAAFAGVTIGDYCFIGRRATILPGCTLGIGASLGAGSVLTKSIPDYEIWAGNPAAKIGERKKTEFDYHCSYRRLFH